MQRRFSGPRKEGGEHGSDLAPGVGALVDGVSQLPDFGAVSDDVDLPDLALEPLRQLPPRLLADGARGFNAQDGVHPNAYGAQLTAELLFRRLDELGWIGDSPAQPRSGGGSEPTRFR